MNRKPLKSGQLTTIWLQLILLMAVLTVIKSEGNISTRKPMETVRRLQPAMDDIANNQKLPRPKTIDVEVLLKKLKTVIKNRIYLKTALNLHLQYLKTNSNRTQLNQAPDNVFLSKAQNIFINKWLFTATILFALYMALPSQQP